MKQGKHSKELPCNTQELTRRSSRAAYNQTVTKRKATRKSLVENYSRRGNVAGCELRKQMNGMRAVKTLLINRRRFDLPCFLSFSSAFSSQLSTFVLSPFASSKLSTVPNLLISSVEMATSQRVLLASSLIHFFLSLDVPTIMSGSKEGINRLSINKSSSFKLISREPDMILM